MKFIILLIIDNIIKVNKLFIALEIVLVKNIDLYDHLKIISNHLRQRQ